jgi:hypothetical protein
MASGASTGTVSSGTGIQKGQTVHAAIFQMILLYIYFWN